MRNLVKTLIVAFLFVTTAIADDIGFKITRAEVICSSPGTPDTIEILFDKSLNVHELLDCNESDEECMKKALRDFITAKLGGKDNYHLLTLNGADTASLANYSPPGAPAPGDPPLAPSQLDNLVVFKVTNYSLQQDYILVSKDLVLEEEKPASAPFLIPVAVNSGCTSPPTTLPQASKPAKVDQTTPGFVDYFAKPGDDSTPHLKVDYSMQGSKRERVIYSLSAAFRPYTLRRLGFAGHYELTPFFLETEYKINASPADKKNVLTIGVAEFNWTRVFRDDGDEGSNLFYRHVPGFVFTMTPKLETEWGLKERNLIAHPRLTLPINVYQSRRSTIRLDPFAGFEYGFVWASEVSKAGTSLQRPLFGASLTANFFRKNDRPLFAFQAEYIRRLFLRPELSWGRDANDELVPDVRSKTPRDHGKFRFVVNATDLFAPFVEYEYGRVPPKYNLINSSFKTGIAFNVDVVWKSFK